MALLQTLNQLDAKFQLLDKIPESLYHTVVTHQHGSLKQRSEGLLQWREALLSGELPAVNGQLWPEPEITLTVLKRLEALEIVKYCQNQEELTDSILLDICDAISSIEEYHELDPGFNDRLAQEQKQRDRDSPFEDPQQRETHSNSASDSQSPEPVTDLIQSDEELSTFKESKSETIAVSEAGNNIPDHEAAIAQHLENNWQQLAQNWDSLATVYNELGGFLGKGWDLTQGLLASQGWQDIAKYQQQVKLLPWLKKLIASLGRCRECLGEEKSLSEEIIQPIKRMIDEEVQIKTPERVMHTSGIKQSDDISRLLPSELALLGNSQLKMLWHAKRAERTLLTYEIDGVMSQHEPIEKEQLEAIQYDKDETDMGYGPILVCLDTSASMQGEIESMAKAITLEALRLAFEENRACHLFMFSGPEQVLQHTLDLTSQGLQELLEFISQSFHGGTDILGPLLLALEKVQEQSWKKADILLISDGRFPISVKQKQKLQCARENNDCRIHALQLGDWQGEGLSGFCDYIHKLDLFGLN